MKHGLSHGSASAHPLHEDRDDLAGIESRPGAGPNSFVQWYSASHSFFTSPPVCLLAAEIEKEPLVSQR